MAVMLSAGLFIGVVAWRLSEETGDEYQGEGEADAESVLDGIDDFAFDLGVNLPMSDRKWSDDLNTRGAAYKSALATTERKYGIPQNMLARLAWQESRFRPDIINGTTKSAAGAVGIMQIVPRWHPGVNPLNPAEAIDYAGRFLADLYRQFGSWELALKAYNWGAANVNAWIKGVKTEPVETRNYSAQILADLGKGKA
ncbi:lytic transglycosylase domain-containing protein [Nitrosovibrio sp. Nv4]|uniref:lytic transglycosylase domain-containing protein n=1 Tax=Nitrosovibrio sp. Nv4 TaxID=1945880 RepID=UPI000BDBC4C0|nr:lytic transglycosylase domain-containing protein [Nitrosovibrio sp. Nv4]SOD41603.1 Transglycosylase SLT domain-containing protein [Nitrosovibrio sp. Nv4]